MSSSLAVQATSPIMVSPIVEHPLLQLDSDLYQPARRVAVNTGRALAADIELGSPRSRPVPQELPEWY